MIRKNKHTISSDAPADRCSYRIKTQKTSILTAILFLLMMSACGSVKYPELLLFQDLNQGEVALEDYPALAIQTDDILSIQVNSRNPENVLAFKSIQQRTSQGAIGTAALAVQEGYRVDESGKIYLPFLGAVEASGKTLPQLREEINEGLQEYILDASVQIRFMNFRVTVLGEVNMPNTYTIPNERVNILEVLGMAGDFTAYAKRDNVLLIRERGGQRTYTRINVQDRALFESPYFYLSPNDVLYVEPLKARQYATGGDFVQRYAMLLFPLVSIFTFILGRVI